MNASPLRSLVARHVCICRHPQRATASISRLLSTKARSHAQYSYPSAAYGSSEQLKRRYRFQPESTNGQSPERAKLMGRIRRSSYGIGLCALALFGTIYFYPGVKDKESKQPPSGSISLDAPPAPVGILDKPETDNIEKVPTGTSTIPTFPKLIHLTADAPSSTPAAANEGTEQVEYQLVGLGIRTVSIFGIEVYVVGLYIAVPDIATLQERLIRTIDPVATTLVPGERGKLKELLLDSEKGEEVWNTILKDGGLRTAFRIVPTRNTDFMHMRDGFVRGITARSSHFASDKSDQTFSDESFGQSLNDFKTVFGGGSRKKIPRGETLLLTRDPKGKFAALYEDKTGTRLKMGEVLDERVGRLLWLNYLAGKSVSSEPARQSVVDGVMEYVERPVGTVAMQVV